MPEYTTVSVNPSSSLVAVPWNGATGGVVAFLATGTVTLSGSINANGAGFRGGCPRNDGSGAVGCTGLDEPAPAGGGQGRGDRRHPLRAERERPGLGRERWRGRRVSLFRRRRRRGCRAREGGAAGPMGAIDAARAVGGEGGSALSFASLTRLVLGGGGGSGHAVSATRAEWRARRWHRLPARKLALASSSDGADHRERAGGEHSRRATRGAAAARAARSPARFAGAGTCLGGIPFAASRRPGGSTTAALLGPGGGGGGGSILTQFASGSCATSALVGRRSGAGNPARLVRPRGTRSARPPALRPGGRRWRAPSRCSRCLRSSLPRPGRACRTPRPTFSGTLAAPFPGDAQVRLLVDDVEVGTVTVDASGNWTFASATPLSESAHIVSAIAFSVSNAVESAASAPAAVLRRRHRADARERPRPGRGRGDLERGRDGLRSRLRPRPTRRTARAR